MTYDFAVEKTPKTHREVVCAGEDQVRPQKIGHPLPDEPDESKPLDVQWVKTHRSSIGCIEGSLDSDSRLF